MFGVLKYVSDLNHFNFSKENLQNQHHHCIITVPQMDVFFKNIIFKYIPYIFI